MHLFLFAFLTFELGKKEKERQTEKEGRQEGRREGEGKEAEVFYDNRKQTSDFSVHKHPFTAICKASSDSCLLFAFLFLGDGLDSCLLYNVTNLHP